MSDNSAGVWAKQSAPKDYTIPTAKETYRKALELCLSEQKLRVLTLDSQIEAGKKDIVMTEAFVKGHVEEKEKRLAMIEHLVKALAEG